MGRYIAITSPPTSAPSTDDHDRLAKARERVDLFVDLPVAERREIHQHRVERAGFLGDRDRLHDFGRKAAERAHRGGEPFAVAKARRDFDGRAVEDAVAGGVRERVEGVRQRRACRQQRAERAAPARDRERAQQRADERQLQRRAIGGARAPPASASTSARRDARDRARNRERHAPARHAIRQREHEARRRGQRGAEAVEDRLEGRHHANQQAGGDQRATAAAP